MIITSANAVKVAMCLIMIATERGIVASKRRLPNRGGNVTRASVGEYAEAVGPRYLGARKGERGRSFDEFC